MIVIDYTKCSGCRSCEIACSFHKYKECNPSMAKIHVIRLERFLINIPLLCQQCETPFCREICPTGAIYKDKKTCAWKISTVKCIGCKLCAMACPIGVISIHAKDGVASKCDLCDGDPKCVRACTEGALIYVEKDALQSRKKHLESVRKLYEGLIKEEVE